MVSLAVALQGPGRFEARVRGWAHHDPQVCTMLRAMLEQLLRAVGYRELAVQRTRCVDQGGAECGFVGAWKWRA